MTGLNSNGSLQCSPPDFSKIQQRVEPFCTPPQAVSQIKEDGTVVCINSYDPTQMAFLISNGVLPAYDDMGLGTGWSNTTTFTPNGRTAPVHGLFPGPAISKTITGLPQPHSRLRLRLVPIKPAWRVAVAFSSLTRQRPFSFSFSIHSATGPSTAGTGRREPCPLTAMLCGKASSRVAV